MDQDVLENTTISHMKAIQKALGIDVEQAEIPECILEESEVYQNISKTNSMMNSERKTKETEKGVRAGKEIPASIIFSLYPPHFRCLPWERM
eukprot:2907556-Rhodomonas_salina.1